MRQVKSMTKRGSIAELIGMTDEEANAEEDFCLAALGEATHMSGLFHALFHDSLDGIPKNALYRAFWFGRKVEVNGIMRVLVRHFRGDSE